VSSTGSHSLRNGNSGWGNAFALARPLQETQDGTWTTASELSLLRQRHGHGVIIVLALRLRRVAFREDKNKSV